MSPRRFEDSWKRIDRAVLHGRAISDGWKGLFDPTAKPEIVPQGNGHFVVRSKLRREDRNDLALELGEFAYQLRAALDGVAFEAMVLDTASDPPPKENRIEFPIYDDPGRFKESPFIKLTGFPPELKAWLESIQSYNIGKSSEPETNEIGRRLKVLHDLARKDRHRRLHVVVAGLSELATKFVPSSPGITISDVEPIPINFLEDSTDFLRFNATFPADERSTITLITMGTVEFGIGELPDHIGQAAMDELERLMLVTRDVVNLFEEGFSA